MNITNLLKLAQRVIGTEKVEYKKFIGISTNEFGVSTMVFDEWKTVRGYVQPGKTATFGSKNISEKDYKDIGLDFSRSYISVWIPNVNLRTVHEQKVADKIRWQGREYNVIETSDWLDQNGWRTVICEEAIP